VAVVLAALARAAAGLARLARLARLAGRGAPMVVVDFFFFLISILISLEEISKICPEVFFISI
jgi:hypothetical protein